MTNRDAALLTAFCANPERGAFPARFLLAVMAPSERMRSFGAVLALLAAAARPAAEQADRYLDGDDCDGQSAARSSAIRRSSSRPAAVGGS